MNLIKYLLRTEFLKFKSNITIKLLLVMFSILMPLVILLGKSFFTKSQGPIPSNKIFYEFPTVWEYQGYSGNWLVFFFLGFMVLQMYTSEISYKTMRQNIIAGYTKREYILGKIFVVIFLSLFATLIYTISSVILGMIHTPGWDLELLMDTNWAPLRFFLMSLGYLSFALLVAVLFKKGGLSMFFYFSYPLILEPIMRYTYFYYFKNTGGNYFPLNAIEDNFTFPLIRTGNNFLNSKYDFSLVNDLSTAGILAVIFSGLFLFLAYRKAITSDV